MSYNLNEDNDETRKEFIFSYYYTFLNATGPLYVSTLEASWEEQYELFTDVSSYVTHGISNFLLNSRKFTFINGKVQTVDDNSSNEIKDSDKFEKKGCNHEKKLLDIIHTEYPSVDQIIKYNIERNKSLIDLLNDSDDENNSLKISQSISLKVNSILLFSNVQNLSEITICVRPAAEYSTHNMHESVRFNGSYSIKCNTNLSDNELNILSYLLRKHLLLLDYRNTETFEYFVLNEKSDSKVDDHLSIFDRCLIMDGVDSELLDSDSSNPHNISFIQFESLVTDLKSQYITKIQQFLICCEVKKKSLRDETDKMQKEVFQKALNNELPGEKFQQQSMNYLISIRNLIEKQIKSFQDKALKILTFLDEINPVWSSNSKPTEKGFTLWRHQWKLRLYEGKENFEKIQAVFDKFQSTVMLEEMLDLITFKFVSTKENPPDNLHSQVKEIIKDNIAFKKQVKDSSTHLQILQEYIYGPYVGILNKSNSKTDDDISSPNFKQAFPSGFQPKLYFVKPSHNLNLPNKNKLKTEKIKTNIRDSDSISQISDFYFNNLKVPNTTLSITGNFKHEVHLLSAISKLSKHVFGVNSCNRFELIVKYDDRKKLSTLNMTELFERLAEYITKYLTECRILMSKERLRYFDFISLPISIYFGFQTKNAVFEPFINIKCNFSRTDNLPHNIEVEIKNMKRGRNVPLESSTNKETSVINTSISSQFNDLKINSSGYPFLNESSESSLVLKDDDQLKSILVSPTGTRPKQPTNFKSNRKSKHTTFNENLITCCICRDHFRKKPKCFLKCEHIFHRDCIETWRQNSKMCPICRSIIIFDEFPPL